MHKRAASLASLPAAAAAAAAAAVELFRPRFSRRSFSAFGFDF